VLTLSRECYEAMIQDALRRSPNEACGILAGASDVATIFYGMTNTDQSPVSYLMEPKEQFKVFQTMRARGERMLGIYHSHVASQAYPSAKDTALAFYPEVHYVIVSLVDHAHPTARAFRIEEEKVQEEPIEIVS